MFKRLNEKKEKKKDIKKFETEIQLGIQIEMEKFAEASAQHFGAVSDLKKVAGSRINPDFEKSNYQQQAGFSAEIKHQARTNADNIIDGKATRIKRTDELGDINHNKYDHVEVDSLGNALRKPDGSYAYGSQQKCFSKVENYDRLYNQKNFDKYSDTPIDVPSDHYDQIHQRWGKRISDLEKQEQHLLKNGDIEKAKSIRERIDKVQDSKDRLRSSKVSSKDAMEARKHYIISSAKDIARVSHKAGVQGAKSGAVFGGAFSTFSNTKSVINGDKELDEAVVDIAKDTAKSAVKSYTTSAASAALGGVLKSSSKQVLKNLAKKNGPTAIISATAIVGKNSLKLAKGEITANEFVKSVGQEGTTLATSMAGSNIGAIVGTAIFPGVGTVIGGVIGGMAASMMSGALYQELMTSINSVKISDEQRKIVIDYCAHLKEQELEYREKMLEVFELFFTEKEEEISSGFNEISEALYNGRSIQNGLQTLGGSFNVDLKFKTKEEFKEHINRGKVLNL